MAEDWEEIRSALARGDQDTARGIVEGWSFEQLLSVLEKTTALKETVDDFWSHLMVEADRTGPHADRRAICTAAKIPSSRLYRLLTKRGRPSNRRAS